MNAEPSIRIKVASEDWEFEAIHELNYATFVEEIPQHAPNAGGRLVDRFHAENIYLVAVTGRTVAAMLVLRNRRPFSLDAKLPDLDRFLPAGRRPVEVRLLAIRPEFRRTSLFAGLLSEAVRKCRSAGNNLAVISATTRQLRLYEHLGFTAFGPRIGSPAAQFQPMFLTLENFGRVAAESRALRPLVKGEAIPLNLLPGPVATSPAVDAALAAPALSHRHPDFLSRMQHVRSRLCGLTRALDVQVVPGSGSLANAMIAAQLGLRATPGLVLANGEFGERLAGDARRARLSFDRLQLAWGTPFDLAEVESIAARIPRGGWLWFVHHETSTGMLNPLEGLKALAARRGLAVCVDCVSSLGAVPVDLSGVHLASSTSGKALGAYPGLALVFHDHRPVPEPDRLPGYLDLGHWAENASIAHTHSSNLLGALEVALTAAGPERMAQIQRNATWLRAAFQAGGFDCVGPDPMPCGGVVTVALDPSVCAERLGQALEERGFMLSFRSRHLLARNWIQVSLLGNPPLADLRRFHETFGECLRAVEGNRSYRCTVAADVPIGHGSG